MGEFKHTPGPWAAECGDHSHRYVHVTDSDDRTIFYKYGAGTAKDADQDEANARLIAAAPELYEVVRDAESGLSTQLGTGNLDAFALTSWLQYGLLPRIRDAIAKAAGAA